MTRARASKQANDRITRSRGGRGPVLQSSDYTHHVLIGRYQPFTMAHADLISQSLETGAKHQTILVGSAGSARNPRNPLRFPERKIIIEHALETSKDMEVRAAFHDGAITIMPLSDRTYDNTGWVASVQESIRNSLLTRSDSTKAKTAIFGYNKDPSTSFYLKMFGSLYGHINGEPFSCPIDMGETLDASNIRKLLLMEDDPISLLDEEPINWCLQPSVIVDLKHFINLTTEYRLGMSPWQYVKAEYDAVEKIKNKWIPPQFDQVDQGLMTDAIKTLGPDYVKKFEGLLRWRNPYALTFNAADAVVIQGGHVLVTERNIWPGRGLLACPGGHLEPGETLFQCALRELHEEVGIELPEEVLSNSFAGMDVFDDPHRSLRGRYISVAYLFHLNPRPELPRLRGDGQNETRRTFWMPISEMVEEDFFEDHFHLIRQMTKKIKDQ